jgi:(E)-4-hydroxy-3-methyl-but-2-enyl pyrophosphate reductase
MMTGKDTIMMMMSAASQPAPARSLKQAFTTQNGRTVRMAQHAGFCHGVKKAVDKTEATAEQQARPTYVLGELIHNKQEIERLAAQGIQTVSRLEDVPDNAVCVIRTHGAPPEMVHRAEARGIQVSDATCPDVRLVQNKAIELAKEGYTVVIVGKANHPEVIGITAHALEAVPGAHVVAIARQEELETALEALPRRRIGVVSQTTQMEDAFFDMVRRLSMMAKELKVHNTICPATFYRQHAAADLAKTVDAMVIVGGKNSSNTTHLAELCRELGKPAFHIETAEELLGLVEAQHALNAAKDIGVTAGASTPDWVIAQVCDALEARF